MQDTPTSIQPTELSKDSFTEARLAALAQDIKDRASTFGFQEVGIVAPDLAAAGEHLRQWLAQEYHGSMAYMERHGSKRYVPSQLVPNTSRVICLGMHYLDPSLATTDNLANSEQGYIARYALGRDYHKLIRKRLAQFTKYIEQQIGPFGHRVFVDSAPVMEKPMAQQAGLGWQGKHTLLINRKRGSWLLLGEIFVDLALPTDAPYAKDHCSRCTACLDVCPTNAFPQPYVLDATRCIAYLTIEHKGSIPLELRPLMGNRVFGCDDCQLVCPWNRSPYATQESDFQPRHQLNQSQLLDLFQWSAEEFDERTQGSPIRRTGYEGWLRNIAIALGNGEPSVKTFAALNKRLSFPSALVQEHVQWAINTLQQKQHQRLPVENL